MSQKYRDMPCVGGYLDGTGEKKVGDGNRRIFDGLNADYGNKRLALIQTSDRNSYSATHHFRQILAYDDRPATMHDQGERTPQHQLPDTIAAL
jgi:hypothetical protein